MNMITTARSRFGRLSKKSKIGIGFIALIFLVALIEAIFSPSELERPHAGSEDNSNTAQEETKDDNKQEEPAKPLTQAEEIEKIVRDLDLNGDVRDFIDGFENSYAVYLNSEYSWDKGYTEDQITQDMAKIYYAICSNKKFEIREVTIASFLVVQDTYGNDKDEVFYQTTLPKTTADKINWDAEQKDLEFLYIPDNWTVEKDRLDKVY